jgi:outer membrane cobalamin receptor
MKVFTFFTFILFVAQLWATDFVIKGKVRHINTNEEISDVNIYIKDLPFGTTTDQHGRFELKLENIDINHIVVFDHVAYDTLQIPLKKAFTISDFHLDPNLLQINKIIVEAKRAKSELAKDLPQSLTIISAREFEGKGYIDVGDLLRVDQTITIEEDLSGKKTISMRGGNAEDVVVFYNGVKMNSNYDNVFDLSLINIEDVEQVEIIKGSNTALFGGDAFSGIINIIPKFKQNYTARFIQKFGSYNSGDWNLQINHKIFDKIHFSYNQKRAGSKRPYDDENGYLENSTIHNSANLVYDFSEDKTGLSKNNISVMYMRSELNHFNSKISSEIEDLNQLGSIRYNGNIGPVDNLKLVASYQTLNNRQVYLFNFTNFERSFFNDNIYLNFEKSFLFEKFSFLMAYQYEDGTLDFNIDSDLRTNIKSAVFTRKKQGGVGILKMNTPTGSEFLKTADISFSYRFDHILNQQKDVIRWDTNLEQEFLPGIFDENTWQAGVIKFSTQLKGGSKDLSYSLFLSAGNNVKFPTMFHQLSTPRQFDPENPEIVASLNPEKNKSTEIGVEIIQETPHIKTIDGWQINLNYFTNLYENKFRSSYSVVSVAPSFDNVPNASLDGIEATARAFLWGDKITLELGASKYFISDKAAFPFKSEVKFITKAMFDYHGYSLKFNWFKEGEQVGWVRFQDGTYGAIPLASFSNFDLHLSKKFDLDYVKINITFSGRNLLSDNTILEGIAIRDRRIYVGMGVEY